MRGYKLPDINRVPVGTKPDLVDLAKVRSVFFNYKKSLIKGWSNLGKAHLIGYWSYGAEVRGLKRAPLAP